MKKILASLAALAIVGSSVTSVVSCGPITFAKLMSRSVSTDVYRGTYKFPISTWSSAVTMQLEDSIILSNAQDTLLATDQHNNFEGDLADAWKSNDNQDIWYFHVRDDEKIAGRWTSLDNNGRQVNQGKIEPRDFFNAFRFIFNPNNMSQVTGIWQTVIKYGDALNQFLNDIRDDGKSDPAHPQPPHPLYDKRFTITNWNDHQAKMTSNLYLDRAIMEFNLHPENPETARNNALDDLISTESIIADSFANGKIVNDAHDQTGYNLAFNLAKPAPYFESMGAFLSFAPVPDLAVDYLKFSSAGENYGRATPNKFGYQTIYYSGPYVVTEYNPTLRIKMEQNKFYFNRQSLKIKELNYAYTGNVDVSRQRFNFETGDSSEVNIQPTDLAGWDKYVGPNLEQPNFEGANLTSRPQAGTYAMIFNYRSTREEETTNAANIALAQRSVRGYIRYVFDRSKVASYYSKAVDKGPTSAMVRNNWTSKNLAIYKANGQPDKDYVNYLNEDYFDPQNSASISEWLKQALSQYGLTSQNYDLWSETYGAVKQDDGSTISALSDGYDPFMHNDLLGALIFVNDQRAEEKNEIDVKNQDLFNQYVPLIGDYSPDAESRKLSLIKDQIHEDLDPYGINQATLTWLSNGTLSTTMNNNVKDAVRTFNQKAGGDSPIIFAFKESIDANDYRVQTDNGKFSVISNGWVPDYADPYTFIHTLVAGGDLETYTGFGRLFEQTFDNQGNVTLKVKNSVDNPNDAYGDLAKRVAAFTNRVSEVDKASAPVNTRYQNFAKTENFAMIESMITLPLFFQFLDEPPFISYVNPFTRSTYTSGQAIYRFVGVEMVSQLWDHKTFNDKKVEWEDEKMNYQSVYPDKEGKLIPNFDGTWNK